VSADDYFAGSLPPEQPNFRAPAPGIPMSGAVATEPFAHPPVGRMGFFDSIRAGFQLLPTCWSVLAGEPALLLVPLVVLIVSVAMLLGYAEILGGLGQLVTGNKYSTAVRIFPIAALCSAVASIGQAVIVSAATERLQGKPSSLSSAWVTTLGQLPRLVFFGIVLAGERTLTSLLRGKRWNPMTVAANVIDRAWDFATFLVIPVILFEDVPVFAAVKRSGMLVASRWGTQLTARSVLSVALFIASLPLFLLALLLFTVSPALGIGVLVLSVLGIMIVSAALTGVLSAAMYRFAVTGLVVPGFREADMWAAFSRR
jgi:hypothetical protein